MNAFILLVFNAPLIERNQKPAAVTIMNLNISLLFVFLNIIFHLPIKYANSIQIFTNNHNTPKHDKWESM